MGKRLGKKLKIAASVAILALGGTIVYAQNASAISLKQQSVVSDNTIKLGDVFEGLNANADKVVGVAPRPGEDMTLNAHTLLRLALALDLPWRPESPNDQVVLTRAATIIEPDMIEDAIRGGLANEGVNGKYKLIIPLNTAEVTLPSDQEAEVQISDLKFKPASNRFEAVLVSPSRGNPLKTFRVSGTVQKIMDVPVLSQTINNGSIIGANDIDYIEIPESDVRPEMVLSADSLIGMTPRRTAYSGKPLKATDLQAPMIIERGDVVTMLFKSGPLVLTASGKALQNGAKGDMIRVTNMVSNETIEGFVTASKEITVKNF